MPVIIRDGKFVEDHFLENGGGFIQLDQLSLSTHGLEADKTGVDVPNDTNPEELAGLMNSVAAIRIPFPSFADGRGFSIAQKLRRMGFNGLLRAKGNVLADQYPLALRSGFDEVEIPSEQAGRQPQIQWIEALDRVNANYLDRLKGASVEKAA
ncbi:MAG: DUF934 domain-containing protein [Salaquimonas sp.]